MADYKFYIIPVTKDGTTYTLGDKYDIESYFSPSNADESYTAGLHYKSITGMEAYGKPRPYVENYAESDMASVELPNGDSTFGLIPRDQTDITLTLHIFFEGNAKTTSRAEQIKAIDDVYHDFIEKTCGAFLFYYDTARQRKALLYQSDKIDPTTDSIKGLIYKEVQIKFKNVFGRTFPLTNTIIETALGVSSNLTLTLLFSPSKISFANQSSNSITLTSTDELLEDLLVDSLFSLWIDNKQIPQNDGEQLALISTGVLADYTLNGNTVTVNLYSDNDFTPLPYTGTLNITKIIYNNKTYLPE